MRRLFASCFSLLASVDELHPQPSSTDLALIDHALHHHPCRLLHPLPRPRRFRLSPSTSRLAHRPYSQVVRSFGLWIQHLDQRFSSQRVPVLRILPGIAELTKLLSFEQRGPSGSLMENSTVTFPMSLWWVLLASARWRLSLTTRIVRGTSEPTRPRTRFLTGPSTSGTMSAVPFASSE